MKLLQINANNRQVTHDLAFALANSKEADFIVISEPNKKACLKENTNAYSNLQKIVQIINYCHKYNVQSWNQGSAFAYVQVGPVCIFSVYISPNITIEEYEYYLSDIRRTIYAIKNRANKHKIQLILTGDFNAKHTRWGDN